MAISSIGVGSGLPLEELLSDLRKSENYALSAIQSRQVQAENRLSAYGTLKNALESLQTAANDLEKADTYGALKTSVSGDAYTASATAKAIPGDYAIRVDKLATSQTIVTSGVADRDTTTFGSGGVITITLNDAVTDADGNITTEATTKTLTLADTENTLNDIVKAINADKDLGFNATLINDGQPGTPHRLLLTATDTGIQASAKSTSVEGDQKLKDLLEFDLPVGPDNPTDTVVESNGLSITSATNAVLDINGIKITSATNTIENAIEGVTLTLNKTSEEANKLSVTTNDSVTSGAINKFVTAYNALQTTVKALTSYDIENQRSSALTGDNLARRLQSDVRNALNSVAPEGDLRSLSQLGITTNVTSGLLEVDDAKLSEALKSNMTDVQNLFAATDGLASRLTSVTDMFNRSGGLIGTTTEGINRSITDLQKQYDVTVDRIDAKMENYRRQFTSLDSLVAQMNSVSSYLTQQLSMLGNLGNDK